MTKKRFRFKVGDHVRITHMRNIFSREYDDRWSGEIFTIANRLWRESTPIYRIKDYNGDYITGTFYSSELQKLDVKGDDTWKVERIVKSKGKGRNKQHYVKWLHWPKSFNSWVNASDVLDI